MSAATADPVATVPLSAALRAATWRAHAAVERRPFVQALLRGRFERAAYLRLLRSLAVIYEALEDALRAGATPLLAPLDLPALRRAPALAADLEALHGRRWRDELAAVAPAADYAGHLATLAATAPERLAAHAYVRYLGDLSGGQLLARAVARGLALPPGRGTAFYDFGGEARARELAAQLRRALDDIGRRAPTPAAIVAEAVAAFDRHHALFDACAPATAGARDQPPRT